MTDRPAYERAKAIDSKLIADAQQAPQPAKTLPSRRGRGKTPEAT